MAKDEVPNVAGQHTSIVRSTDLKTEENIEEKLVLQTERDQIKLTRELRLGAGAGSLPWCGIGLSGGGIRAASLALGVMQALAENDLLRRFDYISSVSGGGYLASSLQWWWSRHPREDTYAKPVTFGLGPGDFPYGPARPMNEAVTANTKSDGCAGKRNEADATARPKAETPNKRLERGRGNLAFLRAHSSYLTPGNGLTAWSMLGVVLRTVVISLLIWIPLLISCFTLVGLLDAQLEGPFFKLRLWSPLGTLVAYQWSEVCQNTFECDLRYPVVYALALYCFYGVCLLFVVAAILFTLVSRAPQDSNGSRRSIVGLSVAVLATCALGIYLYISYRVWDGSIILLVVAGAIFISVAMVIIVSEWATPRSLNSSYWLRRTLERLIGRAFLPSITILAIATIPILPHYLLDRLQISGSIGGVIGLIGGIYSALYGYYTFLRNIVPSLVAQIMATIGAVIYLYATLVTAYVMSVILLNAQDVQGIDKTSVRLVLLGSIVLAVVVGKIANINYVGLHRYYRDRLMEAFMPADSSVSTMQAGYSAVADQLSIVDLRDSLRVDPDNRDFVPRPFPLINTNVIMINDSDHKVATRGGDNFVISPLFIGSNITGWQDSADYIAKNGPFTLASAMAASGAAANASAGYIGTGITMNPLVSAVMSLLNIRLGLWVGNPYHRQPRRIRSIPTFLNPGLVSGIFGQAHKHESTFIELTDGGHFENLGLYELVRRRLAVILIVDGEADPNISLKALVSATRRIEQDFEANLTFFYGLGPERLIMYPGQGYPAGVRYAESPFIVGKLRYKNDTEGTLIVVKATVIKEMDFTTSGYLASNPEFPHQSTVDQFFDPDQFDAYRFLGYESGIQTIKTLQLTTTITDPDAIIARYCASTGALCDRDHCPSLDETG